jgi:peptide-methionine (R)-S-oxide reductase
MQRRQFLKLLGISAGVLAMPMALFKEVAMADEKIDHVELSDDEWKQRLDPKAYDVLRHEGTEAPFTSPLNNEKHAGMFVCAGCGLELFPSTYKFDSGTGWPSFFDVIPGHVEKKTDYKIIAPRTEYHCARCGGHHGHVFEDGPKPTGLRYCNNGAALKFVPSKT